MTDLSRPHDARRPGQRFAGRSRRTSVRRWMATLGLLTMLLAGGREDRTAAAPQMPSAQEEFVPIDELPPEEQLPAAPLLIAAYAFVWLVMLTYLWSLWRRLARVERELATLEARGRPVTGGGSPPAGNR